MHDSDPDSSGSESASDNDESTGTDNESNDDGSSSVSGGESQYQAAEGGTEADLWQAIHRTTALVETRMGWSLFGATNKPPGEWKPNNNEYRRVLENVPMPDPNWDDSDKELTSQLNTIHRQIKEYIKEHDEYKTLNITILTDYLKVIDNAYKKLHELDDTHKSHYKQIVESYNALLQNENQHVILIKNVQKNRDELYVNETKHKQLAENWDRCLNGTFIPYAKGIIEKAKEAVRQLTGK